MPALRALLLLLLLAAGCASQACNWVPEAGPCSKGCGGGQQLVDFRCSCALEADCPRFRPGMRARGPAESVGCGSEEVSEGRAVWF